YAQFGLSVVHSVRTEYADARATAEQCLRLAEDLQDRDLLSHAHFVLANAIEYTGELTATRQHLEQAVSYNDQQRGDTPGPRAHLINLLWLLGYPDQARAIADEAREMAKKLRHALSTANVFLNIAWDHIFRREAAETIQAAETAVAYSQEHGLGYYTARGKVF